MPLERYPDLEWQLHLAELSSVKKAAHSTHLTKKLPLEELEVIYVVGLFDGHPFLELEEWLNGSSGRHLVFLEDDLQALHQLLSREWAKKCLRHLQVHLKFLQGSKDLMLEQCAREFPCEKIAVIGRRTSLKLPLLRKTVLWHSFTWEMLTGHLLHRNILSNLKRLPNSFYVNRTRDAFKGMPAVICGAGPSLGGAIDELKNIRDNVLMMGCGSALSILSHWGLRPHLGVAIDPNPSEKICLQGCKFRDMPLIYGNRLYEQVFELFDGPYGYLRSPTASALEKLIEKEMGLKDDLIGADLGREALSVTTLAISLACFWGCSPIILAGVDLAYSGKNHYAKGSLLSLTKKTDEINVGDQLMDQKSVQGKKESTLIKWVMERDTIDAYAKLYPHLKFIDATGKGLGFRNIAYDSWNAIKASVAGASPIDPMLQKMISASQTPVSQELLKQTLSHFQESFSRCLALVKKLQEEPEGSGKAILYEEELSLEDLFQEVLQPVLESLERVYKLNVQTPFNHQRWKFLQEVIEEYLCLF